jgi:DNA-binding transcriptional MerR regulator
MTALKPGVMSIGGLSAATGIPVATIRTWERRYGYPVAERKPSGHRVYPVSTVPRLRLISQVLARGHRAAEVVPAAERELEALLAAHPPRPGATGGVRPATLHSMADETELLAAVQSFDGEALRRVFQTEWVRSGPLEFVERRAAPFLEAIGDAWEKRELDVRHEHFASGALGDFLRTVRVPLEDRAEGPLAALATLPEERHGLGLQLCAIVFALAGWEPLVLGVETPVDQIVALVREAPIEAVALSCVLPVKPDAIALLRRLRRGVPRPVPVLVGGRGAAGVTVRGVEVLSDLFALDAWLRHAAGA